MKNIQNKNISKSILFFHFIMLLLFVGGFSSCGNKEEKVNACIEKGDFTKAKRYASRGSTIEGVGLLWKVCRAQVTSLIDRGEYSLAIDVAREDGDYGMYFNSLLGKLVSIYNQNKPSLLVAVSSIEFPSIGYSGHWNGKYYPDMKITDINSLYEQYNNSIKQVMIYAKNAADFDMVNSLGSYLKPTYKSTKTKSGGVEWEDLPTDYTQANQIKKELGIN